MTAAQAALRNWVLNLNGVLADKGVYAGDVAINVFISAKTPEGVPYPDPDDIARIQGHTHIHRDQPEHTVTG